MNKYNKLFGDYNPLILDKEQRELLHELQTETFEECLDEYEPRELSDFPTLTADWNSSDEKIQRHLYNTPQLFDLLTDEQKNNDAFVNAYRAGRFNQVNNGMEGQLLPDGKMVSTYWYNPDCTKFYSIDGYQAAIESIISHPYNIFLPSNTKGIMEYEKVPAEIVYIATMREEHPELARELDKAERRAFENAHPSLAEYLWGGVSELEWVNVHYADIIDEKVGEFIAQKSKIQQIPRDSLASDNPRLFENMNMYLLNKEQMETLSQLQAENYYQNVSEIISMTPQNGEHQKYNSAAEVIRALNEKKMEAPYVWGSLSPELRANKDEMLLLTSMYPGALFQANTSVLTVGYLNQAILNNPHVYDVLPPFMKMEDDIIDTYRTALLNQNDWPKYQLDGCCPQYAIQAFDPSPDCPPDKLYAPEAYRDVFEYVLTHHNMPITACLSMPNYPNEIGAALTYISNARTMFPELSQEFDKAEVAAFYSVQDQLIERYASPSSDMTNICAFLNHHNIDSIHWLKQIQDTLCQNVAHEATNITENNFYIQTQIMSDVKTLMNRVPYYDIQERLDLEEFWTKCGECSVENEHLCEEFNNLINSDEAMNTFIKKHFEKGRDLAIEQQQAIAPERP